MKAPIKITSLLVAGAAAAALGMAAPAQASERGAATANTVAQHRDWHCGWHHGWCDDHGIGIGIGIGIGL